MALGVGESVHRAGVLDDPVLCLRRVEILLERLVLFALHEGIVRTIQDQDLRLDSSRRRGGRVEAKRGWKPATATRSAPARAMFSTTAPPKQ